MDSLLSFQLILNPIRDWNFSSSSSWLDLAEFQLILNPIRDWNPLGRSIASTRVIVPINLKPY